MENSNNKMPTDVIEALDIMGADPSVNYDSFSAEILEKVEALKEKVSPAILNMIVDTPEEEQEQKEDKEDNGKNKPKNPESVLLEVI